MHLFNLGEFGQRFGVDLSVADFNDAVVEASKAATTVVASTLRYGEFGAYVARKDLFRCDRSFGKLGSLNRQLRLSRGFLSDTSGMLIQSSVSPLNFRRNDPGLITNLQDTAQDGESDHVYIDYQRGILTIYGVDLRDTWVQVTYDGGFSVTNSNQYKNVPEWLQEMAMLQAAMHLANNRQFNTEGQDDTDSLKAAYERMITSNWRANPAAVLPEATET